MALSKNVVTLQLLQTMQNDVSPVVSQQPLVVENLVVDKMGTFKKRWGYDGIGLGILGTSTQLSNIQYITERRGELVVASESGFYKYASAPDSMIQVSRAIVTEVEKTSIIRNNYNQTNAQMVTVNGVMVVVYEDSRGGFRYSAYDETSKTLLKNDVYVGAITNPTFFEFYEKLFLFYVRTSDDHICFRQIDTGSFDISSTEIEAEEDVFNTKCVVGTNKFFRVKTYTSSKISLGYVNDSDELSFGFIGTDGLSKGDRDAVPDRFTCTETYSGNFDYLVELDNDGTIYHRVVWVDAAEIKLARYDQVGGEDISPVTLSAYSDIHAATFSFSTDDVFVAWDKTAAIAQEYLVYGGKWDLDGTQITAPYIIGAGLALVTEVFTIDDVRYMATTYSSVFQPNVFVMSEYGNVAAKFNKDSSLTHRTTPGLLAVPFSDVGKWRIPLETRTRLSKEGDFYSQTYGVSVFDVVYDGITPTSRTLEKTLYISGSVIRDYDGATFAEAGFLLYPDSSLIAAVKASTQATGTITESGGGSVKFTAAAFGTPGNSVSVSFTSGGTAGSEVVTVVGTAISIQIQNLISTAAQIKTKIEASGAAMALITPSILVAGAMRAGESVTLSGGVGGSLSSGTYQYKAVYAWTDNFGEIHRSGVDETEVVTYAATGNDQVSVTVPSLFATDKSDVSIELYRTEADGTVFYLTGYAVNDKTQTYTTFTDTVSDTILVTKEILYTAGGVLDNTSYPTASALAVNGNRLMIGGSENETLVYYSKNKNPGFGLGMSDFLSIDTGSKGGDIVALKALGENTLVLKDFCIGVISGQFALDTGLDVSLTYDVLSEELGCVSKNSAIETDKGILFQSQRGICLVNKQLEVSFIGGPVESYRESIITSAARLTDLQTIVFTHADNDAICMGYGKGAWTTFTGHQAYATTVIGTDLYMLTTNDKILKKSTAKTDAGIPFATRLRTQWYQLGGLGGFERLYSFAIQGKVVSPYGLNVSVYRDFDETPSEVMVFASEPFTVAGDEDTFADQNRVLQQIRVQPRYQKCSAICLEVSEFFPDGYGPFESLEWHGMRFEIGVKKGSYKFDASQAAKALTGG